MNYVIRNSSKLLVRYGGSDLSADPEIETLVTGDYDVEPFTENFWNGTSFQTEPIDNESLSEIKATKCLAMSLDTSAYIRHPSRYPFHRQITLDHYLHLAIADGLTNRAAYIQSGWDWVSSVMGHYYACEAQVQAATDRQSIDAVQLDLEQFDATDPNISIAGALAIED